MVVGTQSEYIHVNSFKDGAPSRNVEGVDPGGHISAATTSRELSSQARSPIYGLIVKRPMATTETSSTSRPGGAKLCPATLLTARIPFDSYNFVAQAIPAEIGACASLAELYINNNQKVETPRM